MTAFGEREVANALEAAGIEYKTPAPNNLDFYLPALDIFIEVKSGRSDRVAEQMSRAENIILVQGRKAIDAFCAMLA